jgi:hypothetical protein
MIVGFTGTRAGWVRRQGWAFKAFIESITIDEFIHGGSLGSDTLAHNTLRTVYPNIPVHILPIDRDKGSIVMTPIYPEKNFIYPESEPLFRNRMIVEMVDGLIAVPRLMSEEEQSGTWYTIRKAREHGVPVVVIWPNGKIIIERNNEL